MGGGKKDGSTTDEVTTYACCKNEKCNQCVCINCGMIYHKTCLAKCKNLVVIDKTRVKCCTSIGDVTIEKLKSEVNLLKQLVSEKDKRNVLLEEKVKLLETKAYDTKKSYAQKTYADIVTESNKIKKRAPPIMIKPNDNINSADIVRNIKLHVNVSKLKTAINSIKTTGNGAIRLKCCDENETELIKSELNKFLSSKCKIDIQKLKRPRLKIIGVEGEFTIEEARSALVNQNSLNCTEEDLKVVYIHRPKNKNTKTIYVETIASIYHDLIADKSIYIGWQRCRLYEDFNLNRCFNCNAYGHNAKKCHDQTSCAHCAGDHNTNSYPDKNVKKCTNCSRSNTKYKSNYAVDHHAYEEDLCQSYAFYKNVAISRTDYYYE